MAATHCRDASDVQFLLKVRRRYDEEEMVCLCLNRSVDFLFHGGGDGAAGYFFLEKKLFWKKKYERRKSEKRLAAVEYWC